MLLFERKTIASNSSTTWRAIMMKKTLISAAVAASLFALSAPASATLTNWYLDTDGAGGNAPVLVGDWVDLTGTAYVHNTFSSDATNFTFKEVGSFNVLSADGGPPNGALLNPYITAQFVGTGSGTTGGNLNFNPGGSLSVFSGLNDIADFTLQVGSAVLNAGTVLPNGAISFIFKATAMDAGYFFDSAMTDLSFQANSPTGVVLGFATTNVIPSTLNVPGGLVTDYNTAFGTLFGTVSPNGITDLNLSNNGQFRLSVPEPSTLALFGIALLGVGFMSRRNSKS